MIRHRPRRRQPTGATLWRGPDAAIFIYAHAISSGAPPPAFASQRRFLLRRLSASSPPIGFLLAKKHALRPYHRRGYLTVGQTGSVGIAPRRHAPGVAPYHTARRRVTGGVFVAVPIFHLLLLFCHDPASIIYYYCWRLDDLLDALPYAMRQLRRILYIIYRYSMLAD